MKRNNKRFKKFKKTFKELGKQVIQVGAIGQHDDAEMPNADLLAIHEFGTNDGRIPPRSPARKTFRDESNLKKLSVNLQGLIRRNYSFKKGELDIEKITDGMGISMKQMLKKTIKRRVSPPNEPSTLKRKRGDVPLMDETQLVNAIEHGVRTA